MNGLRIAERLPVLGGGASLAVGVFSLWTAPLLVSELIERRGASVAGAGMYVTTALITLTLISVVIAPRIDRVNKRALAALGTMIAAAGFALLAASTGMYVAVASLILSGLGQGLAFSSASGIAAASDKPDRAYGEMTVLGGVYGAAWLFLMPRMTDLIPSASAASLFATLICLPLVALCPIGRSHEGNAPAASRSTSLPGVALLAAVVLLFSAAGSLWGFADRMAMNLGLSARASGDLLAATTVSGFVGSGLASVIHTRFGRLWPIAIAYTVTALCFLVACLARTPALFVTTLIAQSATQMYLVPVQFGLGAALDEKGRLAAAAGSALLLGNAAGPVFGGLVLGAGGVAVLGWAIFAMSIASGVLLAWVATKVDSDPAS